MALVSFRVYIFSRRKKGRGKNKGKIKEYSAVGGSAYHSGTKITNKYNGKTYDYTNRQNILYLEVLLPENAPQEFKERSILWNSVECYEKRFDAQLARQIFFALPCEFTVPQNIALAREIAESFVAEGMAADLSVHDAEDGNPHAYIVVTIRPFNPDGTWGNKATKKYILDSNGQKIKTASGEWKSRKIYTTDWADRNKIEEWRKRYADITNKHLAKNGFDIRIDHRSYKRQGIDRIPGVHLGKYVHRLEKKGIHTKLGDRNREIANINRKRECIIE